MDTQDAGPLDRPAALPESDDDSPTAASAGTAGSTLAEVSRAVVAIHKRLLGKGPVRARATLAKDVLIVILEGGFTKAEETLKSHGAIREVEAARSAMQQALEQDFRAAVETILYRSVRSFMSASDPEHELQAEIFVLEPVEAGRDRAATATAATPTGASGDLEQLGDRADRARRDNRTLLDEHRALRAEQQQSRSTLPKH
jgi:uncharacterized protein YbcI